MMQAMFEEQEEEKQTEVVHKTTKQKLYEVFKELIILVETPEMRKRTLNIFYSWLIVAMVYYGLSFNSKNLGGDRYVNGFISGFVEVINSYLFSKFCSRTKFREHITFFVETALF